MEAYKELFRHACNEEKQQELISCFQRVWPASNIFGRHRNGDIKWNIIPPKSFLPKDLGAWNAPPIHIHQLSPSPNVEAEFAAHTNFDHLVVEFIQDATNQWQPQNQPLSLSQPRAAVRHANIPTPQPSHFKVNNHHAPISP
jgi:hypothetical protein